MPPLPPAYAYQQYIIRRKILTLFGASFHIYASDGSLIGFTRQKAFKLKEDIRIFTDETRSNELLNIAARSIIDFSAAYDVTDSLTGERVGTLRRKGFSSIIRDSWEILDVNDQPVGQINEDSTGLALIRRFLSNLIPQTFHANVGGVEVARYRQHFNPFVLKMTVTINPEADQRIDRRLLLGAGILLSAIEGRQG